MYIFRQGNIKNRFQFQAPEVVKKDLVPIADVIDENKKYLPDVSLPDVDLSMTGSGIKGVKNKLKTLSIHSNNSNGKKKYDKFINLKL